MTQNTKHKIVHQQKGSNKSKIGDTQGEETTLCATNLHMYETPNTCIVTQMTYLPIQNTCTNTCKHISGPHTNTNKAFNNNNNNNNKPLKCNVKQLIKVLLTNINYPYKHDRLK